MIFDYFFLLFSKCILWKKCHSLFWYFKDMWEPCHGVSLELYSIPTLLILFQSPCLLVTWFMNSVNNSLNVKSCNRVKAMCRQCSLTHQVSGLVLVCVRRGDRWGSHYSHNTGTSSAPLSCCLDSDPDPSEWRVKSQRTMCPPDHPLLCLEPLLQGDK